MDKAAAKRLLAVLTAITFLISAAGPEPHPTMLARNGLGMMASGQPCDHCPPEILLAGAGGKMCCGPLACAGVIANLSTRCLLPKPAIAPATYLTQAPNRLVGTTPVPIPDPPTPISFV